MRNLFFTIVLTILVGCSGAPSAAGAYKVEVPQGGEKIADVGRLHLQENGSFTMNSGQLQMKGTWKQNGSEIEFTSGDAGVQMLSSQRFRIEGNTLVPTAATGDHKHWRLTKENE